MLTVMSNTPDKGITIKQAVENVENIRSSAVIAYIAAQNALVGPEDAGMIVDTIEMLLASGQRKLPKIDLLLHSPGGFLDPALKIVRVIQEYTDEFNVIVPFAAKSAATIICLGAKEIVMTSFAELGPIDPIIQHPYKPEVRVPAQSIEHFFEFLNNAETTKKIGVSEAIKSQMASMLDPYLIGSYQTALKSSKQVAQILLEEGQLAAAKEKVPEVVMKLAEGYYSHSFVIDRKTARNMGLNVVNSEDTEGLDKAVRLLFNVYQQHMQMNHIVKVIGNREINRNVQLIANAPVVEKNAGPVNLKF